MAISLVVSDIFNAPKCRDLEIRVIGHSRSLKVVPFIAYGFLLVFYSNFVTKMNRFEIFNFKNVVTLKTG